MTSLSYLLTHRLCRAINSFQCSDGFSILLWPFNTFVAKYTDLCSNSPDMVHLRGPKSSKHLELNALPLHTAERSPVPCARSTVGPRQLFFLCWLQSACRPGLDWRASGGSLFLPGPLTHTHLLRHTHAHTNSIILAYLYIVRQVTLLPQVIR